MPFLPRTAALPTAFARTGLIRLLAAAAAALFTAFIGFVNRRPRATLRFFFRNTAPFVALLDVFGFALLFASIFFLTSPCHKFPPVYVRRKRTLLAHQVDVPNA